MFKKRAHVLSALVFVLMLFSAVSASAQSGFAKVVANGTVATFGGSDTTTVGAVRTSLGQYDVTFTGVFAVTTADDVVINTTAQSANFGLTNALVTFANASTIVVHVFVWRSNDQVLLDNAFFITINIGSAPVVAGKSGSSPQGVTPAADKSSSRPRGTTNAARARHKT
jgi:hypothetical protein